MSGKSSRGTLSLGTFNDTSRRFIDALSEGLPQIGMEEIVLPLPFLCSAPSTTRCLIPTAFSSCPAASAIPPMPKRHAPHGVQLRRRAVRALLHVQITEGSHRVNSPLRTHPALAPRVTSLKPSATVEMTERIRRAALPAAGFSACRAAIPTSPTDPRIIAAAERAMRGGKTHYSAPAGEPALREAIAAHESRTLRRALRSHRHPGDAGRQIRAAHCAHGHDRPRRRSPGAAAGLGQLRPLRAAVRRHAGRAADAGPARLAAIAAADHAARRARIILNSPVNPTGRVLTAEELAAAIAFAQKHDLWIIFDQVYSDLSYDEPSPFAQALRRVANAHSSSTACRRPSA